MIADQIREKRKQQNMTQAELAAQLNVTQGAVAQWENELTTPTIEMLIMIAKVLHCTIDTLINGGGTHESNQNAPNS